MLESLISKQIREICYRKSHRDMMVVKSGMTCNDRFKGTVWEKG